MIQLEPVIEPDRGRQSGKGEDVYKKQMHRNIKLKREGLKHFKMDILLVDYMIQALIGHANSSCSIRQMLLLAREIGQGE